MALLKKQEASKELGISVRSFDRRIAAGEIGIVRVGRLVMVSPAELKAFMQRNSYGGLTA